MQIENLVKERFPRTLMIVLLGLSLALIVGIPIGVIAALQRNSWVDYVVISFSMVGQVIPSYVLAVVMILVFAGAVWNVLPVGGWRVPWPKPEEVVMPVVTLALGPMASIARFTRNQVADTLGQEYIRTARAIVRLYEPDGGIVYFDGDDSTALRGDSLRHKRRDVQMIFQDPLASLNSMMTVRQAIVDPMVIHGVGNQQERAERLRELLEMVGLDPATAGAFPFEFSGGQQQRVGIARALALHPKLLICDEPVSALDVSIQAQILTLLRDLQQRPGLTYIFISHNLAVVEYMSDHIAVMYLGTIMEMAPAEGLFQRPAHPYTRALMTSVLRMPRRGEPPACVKPLGGEVPSAVTPPPGCPFHTRCPEASERCYKEIPELRTIAPEHQVACHLV